jgi:hypothetical protein
MMKKKMQMMLCAALALAVTTPVLAQDQDGQQAQPPTFQRPPAPTASMQAQPQGPPPPGQRPGQPPELNAPREMPGSNNTNVRLELTITDQRTEGAPVTKTVTATVVADRSPVRIRTSGAVRTPMGMRDVVLNVDATPSLVNVNSVTRVRVSLTIEYRPVALESDTEKTTTPNINEQLTAVLEDGKPLVISQSADPATDRKVKVEVKATILR